MLGAIVLAGGLGTRLRAEVPDLPKPMAPVSGRPFLEYQLDYWIAQGVRSFVLSVGYRHEAITGHFGGRYGGAEIRYAVEETPMGTGGGFLAAAAVLAPNEPFLLMNGDTYFGVRWPELDRFAAERGADWCFSLFRTRDAGRYLGMDVAEDGRIVSLGAVREGERLANGGVYRMTPRILGELPAPGPRAVSLEADLLPAAFASGARVFGLEVSAPFIDIGVPGDYRRAQTFLPAAAAASEPKPC